VENLKEESGNSLSNTFSKPRVKTPFFFSSCVLTI